MWPCGLGKALGAAGGMVLDFTGMVKGEVVVY